MARDPNAPPRQPHGFERVYKPCRDSMTAAEARRRRRDGLAVRAGREAADALVDDVGSEGTGTP